MKRTTMRLGLCALVLGLTSAACKTTTSVAGGTGGDGGDGQGGGGAGSNTGGGGGALIDTKVSKVDIVLSIDNSRSMADKQQVLALALEDFIQGLTSPPCVDTNGNIISADPPPAACPNGSERITEPVTDIHVGIVTSSLGGHGSDACSTAGPGKETNNDKGHLVAREDPTTLTPIPTYESKGFLAWDPLGQASPPGDDDIVAFSDKLRNMVLGAGQIGCGYEAQLESWYRFLADPDPYETLTLSADSTIVLNGTDATILDQRKAFLRPDSMLVILSLSDENDCSIRDEGQYYLMAQQKSGNGGEFHLPRARAICESDPANECCFSCGQLGPQDENGNPICPQDATCKDANGNTVYYDIVDDHIQVRCWDQKRRFGIDFLNPTSRYVQALTQSQVTDRHGNVVANPIFSDLDPSDGAQPVRDPGLVVFAPVVGVPWQTIAQNPNDATEGFKPASQLAWDQVLGDPSAYVAASSPYMVESQEMRAGVSSPNGVNGADYPIPYNDDLQYACIMDLPEPRDCSDPTVTSCDCQDPLNENPLCEDNAGAGNTLQVRAKAYPGLRHLEVAHDLGAQGVVGSICHAQIVDPSAADYAYRPTIRAILDKVRTRLQ